MKIAPTPWQVGPVDDTRVEDSTGNEVAQVDGDYNDPDLWPIMEANAKLISAAPDLLSAGIEQTKIISKAQGILTKYLCAPPAGISMKDAISELLGLFDGEEQRSAKLEWDAALLKAGFDL